MGVRPGHCLRNAGGSIGFEKHNAPRWSRPLGCRDFFPIFTSGIAHRWGHYRANAKNCQCVLVSTFVVSHEVPPLCGDCGNDLRFPPGQVRSQRARLAGFCGAAAPQHRRGAPVKGGFGVATPTSIRLGEQMSGAKFGPRVDTCPQRLVFPPYLPIV